jgi:hypothetical protein
MKRHNNMAENEEPARATTGYNPLCELRDRQICVRTKSGRKFRFDITDYHLSADTSRAQIESIARQFMAEKYRTCKWDRDHPYVNVQQEMLESAIDLLVGLVEQMKKCQASSQTSPQVFDPVRFLRQHMTSESISSSPSRQLKGPTRRTIVVWAVHDSSNRLIATFKYSQQKEARELAERLTKEERSLHYVQPVKQASEP